MAGCGGFGSVYLARASSDGSEVAQHCQRSRPGNVTQLATLASRNWLCRLLAALRTPEERLGHSNPNPNPRPNPNKVALKVVSHGGRVSHEAGSEARIGGVATLALTLSRTLALALALTLSRTLALAPALTLSRTLALTPALTLSRTLALTLALTLSLSLTLTLTLTTDPDPNPNQELAAFDPEESEHEASVHRRLAIVSIVIVSRAIVSRAIVSRAIVSRAIVSRARGIGASQARHSK